MRAPHAFAAAAVAAVTVGGFTYLSAPEAQATPTAADLCALATVDTIDKIRQTPELAELVPAGLPTRVAVAAARVALDCSGEQDVAAADAKKRVCAALTVAGLTEVATRLGATSGVKANITPENVQAARRAVACTENAGGGSAATTQPAPTGSATPVDSTPDAPAPWTGPTSFGEGLYEVGRDLPPGLYRTPGPTDEFGCYWARLTANDGSFESIIANDFFNGPSSVTILAGDKFVEFSGSCVWTLDGHEPSKPGTAPAPVQTPIEDAEQADNAVEDEPAPQVAVIPVGGVETGDGSAA